MAASIAAVSVPGQQREDHLPPHKVRVLAAGLTQVQLLVCGQGRSQVRLGHRRPGCWTYTGPAVGLWGGQVTGQVRSQVTSQGWIGRAGQGRARQGKARQRRTWVRAGQGRARHGSGHGSRQVAGQGSEQDRAGQGRSSRGVHPLFTLSGCLGTVGGGAGNGGHKGTDKAETGKVTY